MDAERSILVTKSPTNPRMTPPARGSQQRLSTGKRVTITTSKNNKSDHQQSVPPVNVIPVPDYLYEDNDMAASHKVMLLCVSVIT